MSDLRSSSNISSLVGLTYAELLVKIANAQLKPGKSYILSDFQTIYDYPVGGFGSVTKFYGPTEQLVITALTTTELSSTVKSVDWPYDLIEYTIQNDPPFPGTGINGWMSGSTKGKILWRKDIAGNEAWFDIRNCRWLRYLYFMAASTGLRGYRYTDSQSTNVVDYSVQSYGFGFVTIPQALFNSIPLIEVGYSWLRLTTADGTAVDDMFPITAIADDGAGNYLVTIPSFTGPVGLGNNIVDFVHSCHSLGTFYPDTANVAGNIFKGRNGYDESGSHNNVMMAAEMKGNVWGYDCKNNTIAGNQCYNNTIGNSATDNIIIGDIGENNIGQRFNGNRINEFSTGANEVFTGNNFRDYFDSNVINSSAGMTGNYFGDYIQSLTIICGFDKCRVGSGINGGGLASIDSPYGTGQTITSKILEYGRSTFVGNISLNGATDIDITPWWWCGIIYLDEQNAGGSNITTISNGGNEAGFIPTSLTFVFDSTGSAGNITFTFTDIVGGIASNNITGSKAPLNLGATVVFVPAASIDYPRYLIAKRIANITGWLVFEAMTKGYNEP